MGDGKEKDKESSGRVGPRNGDGRSKCPRAKEAGGMVQEASRTARKKHG